MEDLYFPPQQPQRGSPLLPLWLQQQLQAVPQSDPRNSLNGIAQPLQAAGEGMGGVLAQIGQGVYDTVTLPKRVYDGTADPTGDEASSFALGMAPTAAMSLAVGKAGVDTGKALYSSRNDIANALIPSATAQDPYAAQRQAIDQLRAERQRMEKSNIGPRAKLESLKAIDAQIQSANEALIQRQTGDANLQRDNAAKQAEQDRQEAAAKAAADREKAQAEAPFRERNAPWSTAFNSAALAVPALFGLRAGARKAGAVRREADALDQATANEATARKAFADGTGDAASYARAGQDLSGQYRAYQAAEAAKGGMSGPLAAGGTSAALAGAPEFIDLAMPAGTRAGDNARTQLTSGSFYGQKAAAGLIGAGLYKGGAFMGEKMYAQPTPNTARARAMEAEGGPKTAQQLTDMESQAASAGSAAQSAIAAARGSARRDVYAQQLDDAAHQLELKALKEIDVSPLVSAGQKALEARQQARLDVPQPVQRQLQPPAPIESPTPAPPSTQVTTPNGLTIPDSVAGNKTRINKTYGDQTSEQMQKYVQDRAKSGVSPDALVRKDVASDLNIPPNRASTALKNLQEIAAANNLDISDPKVLRAIAKELNASQYKNKSGKGNSLYGLGGGVGAGVGYGAMPEDQ